MTNLILKSGLWVIIADGEKALFLRNEGDTKTPDLQVVQEMEQDNPATREQGADRPGRRSDGPSAHRSAVDDTDWHRIGKERFAERISERLSRLARRDDFKEFVLVAPPLVLGEMRQKMQKQVADRIMAEVSKTLTNHTIGDIETILQAH
jgi:protein required for attachment to host cells